MTLKKQLFRTDTDYVNYNEQQLIWQLSPWLFDWLLGIKMSGKQRQRWLLLKSKISLSLSLEILLD